MGLSLMSKIGNDMGHSTLMFPAEPPDFTEYIVASESWGTFSGIRCSNYEHVF
jgi:hypothetical protein